MELRKKSYLTCMAVGTATLLLAFNNCSSRDAGTAVQNSADLASSGCKVDPDVLVSQVKDGDYHVQVLVPESEANNFSEKLYLNNQGDPAKAPRWKTNVINWYYNPSGVTRGVAVGVGVADGRGVGVGVAVGVGVGVGVAPAAPYRATQPATSSGLSISKY